MSESVSTVSQQNSQSEDIYHLSAIVRQLHRHRDKKNSFFSPSIFSLQSYSGDFLFTLIPIIATLRLCCCSVFYNCTLDIHKTKVMQKVAAGLLTALTVCEY